LAAFARRSRFARASALSRRSSAAAANTSCFSVSVKIFGFDHPGIRKRAGNLDGEPAFMISIARLVALFAFSLSLFLSGLVWGVLDARSE
jgi:hypothetical protein